MKRLLFLLLLLPGLLMAKEKKKPIPKHFLPGRWVEVKRTTLDSVQFAFSDTLFMQFYARDTFTYKVRDGFVYRGKYTIDDDGHLDFGTVSYDIALRRPQSIILTNPKGIFYYVPDTSALPPEVVLVKEDKIVPVTAIDTMIGRWTVYKKEVGKDDGAPDFDLQIRSVYVTGLSSSNDLGSIYCGNDPDGKPSAVIKGLGVDQSLECVGKRPRIIKVVKCQKGEMILEEAGVSYYLKQFR